MTPPPSQPIPAAEPELRVILLGSSSVADELRKSSRLEFRPARTDLEAVGELADPIDEHSPERAAVVIGNPSGGFDLSAFVRAVRLVDPGVVIVAAPDCGCDDADALTSRRLAASGAVDDLVGCAGAASSAFGSMVETRTPGVVGADASLIDSVAGPMDHVGDEPLLRAALEGVGVMPIALSLIRRRIGCPGLRFVSPGESGGGSEVVVAGKVVGRLACPGLEASLGSHAAWLGRWLELADRLTTLAGEAIVDPLTGAFNRRYFDRYLAQTMAEADRTSRELTLMCFDIDNFKTFNDTYGHGVGDEILREMVRLLRSMVRPADRVCRVGGDEFVVIFYDPAGPRRKDSRPPESVHAIATRFQREICDQRFPSLGVNAPGQLTVSGGLAIYPRDGATAGELLRHADMLALESKRSGKNAITIGRMPG